VVMGKSEIDHLFEAFASGQGGDGDSRSGKKSKEKRGVVRGRD